jgi:hypothetical protein
MRHLVRRGLRSSRLDTGTVLPREPGLRIDDAALARSRAREQDDAGAVAGAANECAVPGAHDEEVLLRGLRVVEGARLSGCDHREREAQRRKRVNVEIVAPASDGRTENSEVDRPDNVTIAGGTGADSGRSPSTT